MFEDLPLWLIVVSVAIVFVIIYFVFIRIRQYLQKQFYPFKKGKHYWCTVIGISDGDTITCRRINMRRSITKIRLAYIDAPESSQAFGTEAHKIVKKLVYKKMVKIHIVDTDRYGRHVAEVYRRRRNINEELIKNGAAWVYADYIKDKKYAARLQTLQNDAKKDKRGLWRNSRAIHPSTYRKNN